MPLLTPQVQKVLYQETDARFWAQTGYKPGQKLSDVDPKDHAMAPVWMNIYQKVKTEWQKGKLATTYDHPSVVAGIELAAAKLAEAVHHVEQAIAAPTPEKKNAHADAAAAAHAQANAATSHAATYQPPTASPQLAQRAADEIYQKVKAAWNSLTTPSPEPTAAAADPVATTRDALDALQAAHAPGKAAATYEQTPAPDAPKAPRASTGTTLAVIGGCFAAIALASALSSDRQVGPSIPQPSRRSA